MTLLAHSKELKKKRRKIKRKKKKINKIVRISVFVNLISCRKILGLCSHSQQKSSSLMTPLSLSHTPKIKEGYITKVTAKASCMH